MTMRMSSLPGGGVGGCGSGGHFLEKTAKHPVRPQVHLNMGVHPPVLDTVGLKLSSTKSTSTSCRGTRKFGGHWFATSVRNWYNSLCTETPLTWVNPHVVGQFQAVMPISDPYYPGVPYSMEEVSGVGNLNPPFWYQATPGSQFDCQDPLQLLNAYPFSNMVPPVYPTQTGPVLKNGFNKSSQPLNPEAKEWIPSSFRDGKYNKSSVPNCSLLSHDKLVLKPFVFTDVPVGFEEITDNEINDVRKNCNIETPVPKKAQDYKYREMSDKPTLHCNGVVGSVAEQFNDGTTMVHVVDTLNEQVGKNCNVSIFDERHKGNTVQSYASIAGKSPEPPLPPLKSKKEIGIEKECVTAIESVQQRIPKIFMKDKKYPKEKAAPSMESKRRDPLPFRTASKTQKKSRRKFLKDLRDVSPAKSDSSFSGNESSFESTNPEVMSRLCGSGLPLCMSSPKENSVGSCYPSKNVKSQHSTSESSTSSFVRTMSESSTGSVESVDVEFVDVVDRGGNEPENICVLTEKCPSNTSTCGKQPNSILAYILGLDDSESEDSDEDTDDGDWDDVGECVSLVLDDSWETFGLTIPLTTNSSPCARVSVEVNKSENICDNDYNFMLDDINKRWEDEVTKDVKTASAGRVSFGDVSVHSMVTWAYAYKNARRGPWEQYARDRVRFSNRISEFEPLLSSVLQADHRNKMYCKIYGH